MEFLGTGKIIRSIGAYLKRPKISDVRLKQYTITGIPINSANTDVGNFIGLPTKYRVRSLTAFDASGTPILGSLALYTAAAAGGTNLVAAATITALTAASKFFDFTLAVTADYQTATTLYLRNVIANAAAVTVSVRLEIEDLTTY